MNSEQQYSRYFSGSSPSPKGYPKNTAYLGANREEQNNLANQHWNRPFSNQNAYGSNKKELFTPHNRKNNQEGRFSNNLLENNQLDAKYPPGNRQQTNNREDEKYYRAKGIGLTSKYRTNSNDKVVDKEEIDRNLALKNSQSQGQLLKGNYQKSKDQKPTSSPFSARRLPEYGQKTELSQYKKLYDKLDSLENKLAAMKINLEKKKAEK